VPLPLVFIHISGRRAKSCGAANPGRSCLSGRLDPLKAGLRAGLPAPLSASQPIFSQALTVRGSVTCAFDFCDGTASRDTTARR